MISKFLTLIIGVFLIGITPAYSAIKTTTVEGRGTTHKDAVTDGLQQAISQISGITLSTATLSHLTAQEKDITINGKNESGAKFTKDMQQRVASKINGHIASYQINSERKENNEFVVNMTVNIEKYEITGMNNNRRNIAILGFKPVGTPQCLGQEISYLTLNEEVTDKLVAAFTATRKFNVLDRQEEDVFNMEKAFIQTDDVSDAELTKLGNVKGTDYIITGKIKNFRISEKTTNVEMTGESYSTRSASALFEYKLILFATRQIKMSSSFTVTLSDKELSGKSCPVIISSFMNKAANKIAIDSVDNIYPARVLRVTGENVYFNIGGESVTQGSRYGIYAIGEAMVDPYTGESLGEDETRIGTLVVTEVKPKYSVAVMEIGDITEVQPDQIVRKDKSTPAKKVKRKEQSQKVDYTL